MNQLVDSDIEDRGSFRTGTKLVPRNGKASADMFEIAVADSRALFRRG